MAMILNYYGRDYTFPWEFKADFVRPFSYPRTGRPRLRMPTVAEAMQVDIRMRGVQGLSFAEPYEWYEFGLPRNRLAFQLLSEISGFRGFDRPAFGSWTAEDVESRLQDHGPYVFCGFWNGFPHAILVVGIVGTGDQANVISIDPAIGFPTQTSLEDFNSRMDERMREFNFNRLNPLYMPNSTPVGDTVIHES